MIWLTRRSHATKAEECFHCRTPLVVFIASPLSDWLPATNYPCHVSIRVPASRHTMPRHLPHVSYRVGQDKVKFEI